MLNFSFWRQQETGILTFSGDITCQHNDDFKSALMMSISNSDNVVVNFDEVSSLDRSCLQTFCTALRVSRRLKKRVLFNLGALAEKARHSGIACTIMGCDMRNREGCLLLCQKVTSGATA